MEVGVTFFRWGFLLNCSHYVSKTFLFLCVNLIKWCTISNVSKALRNGILIILSILHMNNLIYHPTYLQKLAKQLKTFLSGGGWKIFRVLVGVAEEGGGWDGSKFQVCSMSGTYFLNTPITISQQNCLIDRCFLYMGQFAEHGRATLEIFFDVARECTWGK